SNVIESMYHGISPGNFQQLSHYDAFRGELYRDFADPVGVASRTLTEGLFGFFPKLMDGHILIKPGFPQDWDFAEIELPEWRYAYKRKDGHTSFEIHTQYRQAVQLKMEVPVSYAQIKSVKINGNAVSWVIKPSSINRPVLVFDAPAAKDFKVEIIGEGQLESLSVASIEHPYTEELVLPLPSGTETMEVYDPQKILREQDDERFSFLQHTHKGAFFVKLRRGEMTWWQAINMDLVHPIHADFVQRDKQHYLLLKNRTTENKTVYINGMGLNKEVNFSSLESVEIALPTSSLSMGTNKLRLRVGENQWTVRYIVWDIKNHGRYQPQDLSAFYNARVRDIFEQRYLSPRTDVPTLQLPWQGIGNWCYPLTE